MSRKKCAFGTAGTRGRCIAYKPNNKRTYAKICPEISLKAQLDKSPKALTRLTPRFRENRESAKLPPRDLLLMGKILDSRKQREQEPSKQGVILADFLVKKMRKSL